jgi:hypothetical protein
VGKRKKYRRLAPHPLRQRRMFLAFLRWINAKEKAAKDKRF